VNLSNTTHFVMSTVPVNKRWIQPVIPVCFNQMQRIKIRSPIQKKLFLA